MEKVFYWKIEKGSEVTYEYASVRELPLLCNEVGEGFKLTCLYEVVLNIRDANEE